MGIGNDFPPDWTAIRAEVGSPIYGLTEDVDCRRERQGWGTTNDEITSLTLRFRGEDGAMLDVTTENRPIDADSEANRVRFIVRELITSQVPLVPSFPLEVRVDERTTSLVVEGEPVPLTLWTGGSRWIGRIGLPGRSISLRAQRWPPEKVTLTAVDDTSYPDARLLSRGVASEVRFRVGGADGG